jgi:hypothetical protein
LWYWVLVVVVLIRNWPPRALPAGVEALAIHAVAAAVVGAVLPGDHVAAGGQGHLGPALLAAGEGVDPHFGPMASPLLAKRWA